MKSKILLLALCCLSVLLTSESYAKRGYSYSYKSPRYNSGFGRTHSVRPYFKKDSSYVQRHRSADPRSGIHCHNNVCF